MAAHLLQSHEGGSQVLGFHTLTRVLLADVVVLAVLAAQVAACEKDRARTVPPAQRVLLAHVSAEAAHSSACPCAADA